MNIKTLTKALVGIGLVAHLTACGTLLYPERKGQTDGRIDPGVAALNGVGLLLFIIPGLIAFAVDFNNGTIYLPNSASNGEDSDELYAIKNDGPLTYQQAQQLIEKHTGQAVDLSKAEQSAVRDMNQKALAAQLNRAQQTAH